MSTEQSFIFILVQVANVTIKAQGLAKYRSKGISLYGKVKSSSLALLK